MLPCVRKSNITVMWSDVTNFLCLHFQQLHFTTLFSFLRRNLCLLELASMLPVRASVHSWITKFWHCSKNDLTHTANQSGHLTTYMWASRAHWSLQPTPQSSQLNEPKSCATPFTRLFFCNYLVKTFDSKSVLPGVFCWQGAFSCYHDPYRKFGKGHSRDQAHHFL